MAAYDSDPFHNDSWSMRFMREGVVQRLEEARKNSSVVSTKTSEEMEEFMYFQAKSREEYMALIAQLLIQLREKNNNGPDRSSGTAQMNGELEDPSRTRTTSSS